jgi:hypothetical protein
MQGFKGKDEEHGCSGISLSEGSAMRERLAWTTIEKDAKSGRRQHEDEDISPFFLQNQRHEGLPSDASSE